MTDCQKLQDWRSKRLYCYFRLSVVVTIVQGQFLCSGRGRKLQVCRWNCSDICHILSDIQVQYFRFGLPYCYFRLSVNVAFICGHFLWVDNFVYRARITVILTSDLFGCVSLWLWLCFRWRPITTSGFVRHLENVRIPLFSLLPSHLTIFQSSSSSSFGILL